MKTNFSFEVQYTAGTTADAAQRGELMKDLDATLQKRFAADDAAAAVVVSESHKGNGNKIVELTTTLEDARIAEILKAFSDENGVTISALE